MRRISAFVFCSVSILARSVCTSCTFVHLDQINGEADDERSLRSYPLGVPRKPVLGKVLRSFKDAPRKTVRCLAVFCANPAFICDEENIR